MKEQNQKLGDSPVSIKQYFEEMPKKRKIIVGVVAAVIILFSVAAAVMINKDNSTYRVLYRNIDTTEGSQVYQTLKDMGAMPQMNENGEVMVLKEEYDIWLLRLAEKGFPQSALPYDLFSSHSNMTTTESERQQWLIYQLQDRIQETLKRITGVSNAVVTITMPENSDYIWDQATKKERATASVLLTLKQGTVLEASQIMGIKTLVAAAVPQMDPADVKTVDAETSLELKGSAGTNGITTGQNMDFEQTVQKQLEDNIVRLLEPRYGADGVVAVAKVTLNYDKMITESMQLQEKPGGGGNTVHAEGSYTLSGSETLGGIVGEEDNTDVPTYGYNKAEGASPETYYSWNTDVDYSYIKTQVEKGNAILERATVSVMVEGPGLTQAQEEELISLISRSVDIEPELIFVSSFEGETVLPTIPEVVEPEEVLTFWQKVPIWAYAVAGTLLFLLIFLAIFLVIRNKRKKAETEDGLELAAYAEIDEDSERRRMEEEIAAYKKQLAGDADSQNGAKDDAIMEEVRGFAKTNPEITASLLRNWLREDE